MMSPSIPTKVVDQLTDIVGVKGVINPADAAPMLEEWRGRWAGKADLVLAPATPQDLSAVMKLCFEHGLPVTPQGGNTGLVGGQIPDGGILINLKRMRNIRETSPLNNSITVEAGLTLAEVQNIAHEHDRLFPLSIGAEGSCQIGGNISSNAGGVNVLRYGNMRDLVLGLEVVLPNGDIWNGLNSLRKDNTGYDLKHLFIGGEGTLGIITAATLKLYPRPKETVTAFASIKNPQAAVELLALAQDRSGAMVSSFELLSRRTVDLVLKNVPDRRLPLAQAHDWYILMEITSGQATNLADTVEAILETALETSLILDATIAQNETQAQALWNIRHDASAGMKPEGPAAKGDVSVPIHKIPEFLATTTTAIETACPGARVVAFGHLGDGNIHYDIVPPIESDLDHFAARIPELERIIHEHCVILDGSISAEHGIGVLKRDELAKRKSPVEMQLMRAIKNTLDPKGIMNPGKLL